MSVKLHGPNGIPLTACVVDNEDGTYTATYTPVVKGDHQITVHVRGKPIQDSPYDLQVTAGIDCEKIGPLMFSFTPSGNEVCFKLNILRFSRNLLTICLKYCNLIGYRTHYLSDDR